ncbi:MAG: TrkH family potassium uptake protein [Spirochaetales bacterium]|nr:TrkH family potassium uptake protein [Spirochaetales bacterium]
MKRTYLSDKQILLLYFLFLIASGTGLLLLPSSFRTGRLGILDALFTTVSAVCVTGLSTVPTGDFSFSGQIILLCLIQAGGLGFITFSTLYLFFPGSRLSFSNRAIIQEYYGSENIQKPRKIIRRILTFTLLIELTGMLIMYPGMVRQGVENPVFASVFHGISAFCNAGFSLYSDSLTRFASNPAVMTGISFLIITGGMGFMVLWNLFQMVRTSGKRKLKYHSKVMLFFTAALLLLGFLIFFFMERNRLLAGLSLPEALGAALFQSITTRTAGFNTVDQAGFSMPSYLLNIVLMLIGGGSGSTAGGIKVTTMFLLLLIFIKGIDDRGEISFLQRRISRDLLGKAGLYFLKALAILFVSLFLVTLFESFSWNSTAGFQAILFECVSALGTVGLSMGITSELSDLSQLVLICTMFAGRIGLFAIIIPVVTPETVYNIRYPEAEVLIG